MSVAVIIPEELERRAGASDHDRELEEWRPVPGWEGLYSVSDLGRVRSEDRVTSGRNGTPRRAYGRVLRPTREPHGYMTVGLSRPRTRRQKVYVHDLVLTAFRGPRPDGDQCCHGDGTRDNNRLSNLRWGTVSDNAFDAVRHGTHAHAAATHCPNGHAYDESNTRIYDGRRYCRACHSERSRA